MARLVFRDSASGSKILRYNIIMYNTQSFIASLCLSKSVHSCYVYTSFYSSNLLGIVLVSVLFRTPSQVRARDSPVIVVATHADSLPQAHYKAHVNSLQSRLKELYSSGPDSFAFPRICSVMHVVNSRDSRHMEQLRNYIYNTAVQYCPPCTPHTELLIYPDKYYLPV